MSKSILLLALCILLIVIAIVLRSCGLLIGGSYGFGVCVYLIVDDVIRIRERRLYEQKCVN